MLCIGGFFYLVGYPSGTRTATTTTAACGRNREELLGPCSDFSKPCQGAAEKSANTTRKALTVRFCCGFHPLGMSTGEPSAAVQNSGFFYLAGCPVGLEPTVSRSTIWRVNRLRYGHHIDAPEGTRTPGPLLRRQLLYPPELRAHVVIPWVPLWRQLCVGTRCEKYNTIQAPFCQAKNAKIFFLFSKPAKHCFTAATCPQSPKQSQARLRPRHRGYGARRSAHGQHR